MRYSKIPFAFLTIGVLIVLQSCMDPVEKEPNIVVFQEPMEPNSLNPLIGQTVQRAILSDHIYQGLLTIDYRSLKIIPLLASAMPKSKITDDGKLHINFTLRPEAKWDNGASITAKDVEFSLKVLKNPMVNAHRIRHMYTFIEDFIFDTKDPLSFTLVCENGYMLSEVTSGNYPIIPAYIYDEQGLMANFTVRELTEYADSLQNDPDIIAFATTFNSEKFLKEIARGSGPYILERWEPKQRIILKKKANWWGDGLRDIHHWFEAYPEQVIMEIIADANTALVALKAGDIDVMRNIPPKDFFEDMTLSDKFKDNFNRFTPDKISYEYIGINMRLQKLSDKMVRQALAHLLDMDNIIKNIYYDQGRRLIGYIHPAIEDYFNDQIKPYPFDIDKAKELLSQAGWKDSNGNGIIDKEVDGEMIEFEVNLMYRGTHEQRAKVALIFKEDCRKAGVTINLIPLEPGAFIEKLKKRDFELYILGLSGSPIVNDPKQSWHTDMINEGSNFVGFGNPYSDELIERIRTEMDEEKRIIYYKEFQKILHDEVPCIFMCTSKERIAIHKKFSNVFGSAVRPGYWDCGFMVGDDIQQ